MSLRFRIAGTIFGLGTLLVAAVLWMALTHSLSGVRVQIAATEDVTIRLLGDLSRAALLSRDYAELQSFIANTEHDPRIDAVILSDTDGSIVASTEPGLVGTRLGPLEAGPEHYWRLEQVSGYRSRSRGATRSPASAAPSPPWWTGSRPRRWPAPATA